MKFSLPEIYPITDCRLTGLSHLEQVRRLVAGGARFIQLREKRAASREFYEAAKAVMDFAPRNDVKIIINDRADIALAVKADGVHLGQDDLPPRSARKILGEKAIIGFSTHNIEQAIKAAESDVDYITVGPVFATSTKENPDPVIGLEGLRKTREAIKDFPLVGIGGIGIKNLHDMLAGGADSAAIVSGILIPARGITRNYENFVKHLQNKI